MRMKSKMSALEQALCDLDEMVDAGVQSHYMKPKKTVTVEVMSAKPHMASKEMDPHEMAEELSETPDSEEVVESGMEDMPDGDELSPELKAKLMELLQGLE